VTGKTAEAWNPQNGKCYALAQTPADDGRTRIALRLEPYESLFVVFRPTSRVLPPLPQLVEDLPIEQRIGGPWTVSFTPGRGAPRQITLASLVSWTDSADFGVRHYSGTARYEKTINLPVLSPGERLVLDLGDVKVVAAVRVNGKPLGQLWKLPYAVDITSAVHAGPNRLTIDVANLWANRLIADSGLPPRKRVTWTTWNPYHPNDPLLPSGLLGPVVLRLAH
jgi:(4-O-methyl)-D-glucuronate---lignin esterase